MKITINDWQLDIPEELTAFLERTEASKICPDKHLIYRALEMVSPQECKVVVLGQDPYHSIDANGNKKANGLAFGISNDWKGPRMSDSMAAIRAEAYRAYKRIDQFDYTLNTWASQGVLLLNTRLTTETKIPLHKEHDRWEPVLNQILKQVPARTVWMLWGHEAQVLGSAFVQAGDKVISCSHPSPMSNYRTATPFIGSDCFRKCNQFLHELDMEPISWLGESNEGPH